MSYHKKVTGSCNLMVIKFNDGLTIKGIVDCGLFQEREYLELNKKLPFNAKGLDFVLVTHNHVDHTGRLPLLIKKGYTKNIYMTYVTENLIPLAMEDSLKVLTNLAKRIMKSVNTKATGILGEQFFRIDSYGFVKSMNTKFN